MSHQESETWYVECGAHTKNGYFTRNHMMTVDKINDFRFKYSNVGVYRTAYIYNDTNQKEASLLGNFYLDLDEDLNGEDPESAFNSIRGDAVSCVSYLKFVFGIPEKQIRLYFSGNKGLHIIVPYEVFDIKPTKNLNILYRNMAEEISKNAKNNTIDLKIYDNKRLFRMINSRHQKSGLYKIELNHQEVRKCTLEEIQNLAKMPRPYKAEKNASVVAQARGQFKLLERRLEEKILKRATRSASGPSKPLDFTPPCIEHLLNNQVGEGQRNCTVAVLTSFLHQQQIAMDEARDRLEEWNYKQCSPPMEDGEIENTLNSVYNGGYSYGCSTARILSVCDKEKCPMGKGKKR